MSPRSTSATVGFESPIGRAAEARGAVGSEDEACVSRLHLVRAEEAQLS